MSEPAHVVLAFILTLMLICQARVFVAVLCSRREHASRRQPRITELVWVAIPVVAVLCLAARSWVVAFDLGPPVLAGVAPVEVSAQPSSLPILHR